MPCLQTPDFAIFQFVTKNSLQSHFSDTMALLADKVFAITGGASGMGLATARRLAHAKAKAICIGDFNDANFENVRKELETIHSGMDIQMTKLDVSGSADVNAWITDIVRKYNALDGCVNAAGVPQVTGARDTPAILEETDEMWERTMGVNLNGVFYCLRAQIGAMVKLPKAPRSIVNIASMAALRYTTDTFGYTTSKFGVVTLTVGAAKDVEEFGIRVNAISPGKYNFFELRSTKLYRWDEYPNDDAVCWAKGSRSCTEKRPCGKV